MTVVSIGHEVGRFLAPDGDVYEWECLTCGASFGPSMRLAREHAQLAAAGAS